MSWIVKPSLQRRIRLKLAQLIFFMFVGKVIAVVLLG